MIVSFEINHYVYVFLIKRKVVIIKYQDLNVAKFVVLQNRSKSVPGL
jgi:hypothetical protein